MTLRAPAAAQRSAVRLTLQVQNAERFTDLPSIRTLRRWIRPALSRDALLTLRFVDAREGRRLNRDYRNRDYATNVLTFDYAQRPRIEADIVLSVPIVRREAGAQGKRFRDHLAHLIVHGVLHAQGYDHHHRAGARRMEARERRLLAALGIDDPYRRIAET